MKKKALAKEDRLDQIITWFAIRVQKGNEDYATPHQIAKGLGLAPSTKFRGWLSELVNAGRLDAIEVHKSGRYPGKVYMLKAGSFYRPVRTIPLNVKGKPSGQLELFT